MALTVVLETGQMLCAMCDGARAICEKCEFKESACREEPTDHPYAPSKCSWCDGSGIEPSEGIS
jgi:hypothetical protein